MTSVLLAAGVVALSVIAISYQRSAVMPVALRVLPAALLFLTVPAASSGYWMIREFREIAAQGTGGQEAVARLMYAVSSAMLWGTVGLAGTMVIAAMMRGASARSSAAATLQIAESGPAVIADPAPAAEAAQAGGGVPKFFGLIAPAAIVPAVFVAILMADVGGMMVQATKALAGPNPSTEIGGMALADLSRWISVRLIVIVGFGAASSIGLLLLALLNMLPMRQAVGRGTVVYGRIAAAVTAVAAIWLAIRFWGLLGAGG